MHPSELIFGINDQMAKTMFHTVGYRINKNLCADKKSRTWELYSQLTLEI